MWKPKSAVEVIRAMFTVCYSPHQPIPFPHPMLDYARPTSHASKEWMRQRARRETSQRTSKKPK
eukprot:CCRYP_008397-RB/>CCRYP_008397-RB protein AED:0.46 eAED:0.56 QI:96/0/0.66/1/0/0/3/296/63